MALPSAFSSQVVKLPRWISVRETGPSHTPQTVEVTLANHRSLPSLHLHMHLQKMFRILIWRWRSTAATAAKSLSPIWWVLSFTFGHSGVKRVSDLLVFCFWQGGDAIWRLKGREDGSGYEILSSIRQPEGSGPRHIAVYGTISCILKRKKKLTTALQGATFTLYMKRITRSLFRESRLLRTARQSFAQPPPPSLPTHLQELSSLPLKFSFHPRAPDSPNLWSMSPTET